MAQPPQRNMTSNFQKELLFLIWIDFFFLKAVPSSPVYQTGAIMPIPTHQGAVLAREVCCF